MSEKEIKQLRKQVNDQKHEISRLITINNTLKVENEQLKSEIKDFQELLAGKEEELLKPIIRLIDEKIEEIKQYNSELCRLTLMELRKEITE